jgi:hypothetical protein
MLLRLMFDLVYRNSVCDTCYMFCLPSFLEPQEGVPYYDIVCSLFLMMSILKNSMLRSFP